MKWHGIVTHTIRAIGCSAHNRQYCGLNPLSILEKTLESVPFNHRRGDEIRYPEEIGSIKWLLTDTEVVQELELY